MKLSLSPVKPRRISDQVYDQIRELIFRGEVKPGERLMPERELAATLSVSRTTVRDALNKLVALGLLEQRQGQGTFVRQPDPAPASGLLAKAMESEDASLEHLLEVRLGMECNAAALAALRATDRDLRLLESSIDEMEKEVAAGRLGTSADAAFHMTVSYATHNPVQIFLMKRFYDYLFYGIHENLSQLYQKPGNIALIVAQHNRIARCIRDHDPEAAYQAMKTHIQFVLDFFAQTCPSGEKSP